MVEGILAIKAAFRGFRRHPECHKTGLLHQYLTGCPPLLLSLVVCNGQRPCFALLSCSQPPEAQFLLGCFQLIPKSRHNNITSSFGSRAVGFWTRIQILFPMPKIFHPKERIDNMNRLAGIYSTRSNHISVVEVRKSFVSLPDCFTKGCSAKYNTNSFL